MSEVQKFPIRVGDLTYNEVTLRAKPLTLGDIHFILGEHRDLIKAAVRLIQESASQGDPATAGVAGMEAFTMLEPVILQAVAISTGYPDEPEAFRHIPGPILAQFVTTVLGLTVGGTSVEEILALAKASPWNPMFAGLGSSPTPH